MRTAIRPAVRLPDTDDIAGKMWIDRYPRLDFGVHVISAAKPAADGAAGVGLGPETKTKVSAAAELMVVVANATGITVMIRD